VHRQPDPSEDDLSFAEIHFMQVRFTLRMSEIIMLVTALAKQTWSKDVSNIASASVLFELRSALEIWPSRPVILMSVLLQPHKHIQAVEKQL
jgi:hypothetical protein